MIKAEEKIKSCKVSKTLLFSVALFAAFTLLSYLFPYTGDDWAWGSQVGLDRLSEWFADYNGRYAGNLLVLALTRSKLLSSVVMGACFVGVCLLPFAFASFSGGLSAYVFSAFLFLLLPREIFAQAVAWTSGFSNYVPPILMTMLYMVAVKNIFDEQPPRYNRFLGLPLALTGFVSALFMENITLFNIGVAVFVIGYTYVKFKRVFAPQLMYFIGCISGAVVMFSNSAYGLIAKKQDFYRTTVFERGFTATLTENLKEVAERFFAENIAAVTVFSLLLAALYFTCKGFSGDRKKHLAALMLKVNIICLVPFYCKGRLYDWDLFFESGSYAVITSLVLTVFTVLYFVSALMIIIICIKDKKVREKTAFLMLSIPMLILPLLVVSPIGPRCFFPPYLMLTGASVLIFVYLQKRLNLDEARVKKTCVIMVSVCTILISFLFGVYGVVHRYDKRRNDLAERQAAEGFKTIMMYYLPYTYYVWNGDPDIEPWAEHYKEFHGIDEKAELKFILRDNYDDFEENFIKQ